jgi:holo-[acyl-carrier protein] synthase
MTATVQARVGIDLVRVEDVRRSVATHGDRWLARVYTARELAACRVGSAGADRRLAARFAAKEAVMKVLAGHEDAVPFAAIEVTGGGRRAAGIDLHGPAAALAAAAGLTDLRLDLTDAGDHAMAVVIAATPVPRSDTPAHPGGRSRR